MGDGLSKRWLFSLCFEQLVHIGWSGGAGLECYSWEHKLVCRRQWHGRVSSMLRLWRGCHNPLPEPSSKSLHESDTKPFPSPESAIEWEPAGTPWVECSEFGHVCRPGTLFSLAEELAHVHTVRLCLQRLRLCSSGSCIHRTDRIGPLKVIQASCLPSPCLGLHVPASLHLYIVG